MNVRVVLLGLLGLALACRPLTAGREVERRLGIIEMGSTDTLLFVMPDTVNRSMPFEVTVRTFGGGCTTQGETEVSRSGNTAEIRPFDFVANGNAVCTADLRSFMHRATLQFETSGTATVRVRGLRAVPGTVEVVRERTITVR